MPVLGGVMTDDRRSLARVPWRTLSTRPIYANRWMRVREDIAEMPDGGRTIYGVLEAKPAVAVLPFVDGDTVLLVGQYRYVFGGFFWEIPAGMREGDESELGAVERELAEETGYIARHFERICTFQTSKSFVSETAHIYIATELAPGPGTHEADATEFIEVRTFPFAEAIRMVERSEIQDALSVVAILHAARRRAR
jgi:ADP-ribose pyrophosphatase